MEKEWCAARLDCNEVEQDNIRERRGYWIKKPITRLVMTESPFGEGSRVVCLSDFLTCPVYGRCTREAKVVVKYPGKKFDYRRLLPPRWHPGIGRMQPTMIEGDNE